MNLIEGSSGIGLLESPITIYGDNVACITEMQTSYIKNNTKGSIVPKLFTTVSCIKKKERLLKRNPAIISPLYSQIRYQILYTRKRVRRE